MEERLAGEGKGTREGGGGRVNMVEVHCMKV
jgi:hypothetical protein